MTDGSNAERPSGRGLRLLLGAASAWPIAYLLGFLVNPWLRPWFARGGWRISGGVELHHVAAMGLLAATLVVGGLALVGLAVNLSRTRAVTEDQRLPWMLLLLLAGPVAMPVYWWIAVWREEASAKAVALDEARDR